MRDPVRDAELYLKSRLAEGDRRPDLHKHIREVYKQYIKIIQERPGSYESEVGDMFAVMKAEQLDRNDNFMALYQKLQHVERVEVYDARKKAVQESTGYGDLYSKTEKARKETEPRLSIEYRRRECVQELFQQIVAWRVAIPAQKNGHKQGALKSWNNLAGLDPQISWNRLKTWPPYRSCLYYTDEHFRLFEQWFKEIGA